jgi:anti-sigma factor RsiW
VGDLTCAEVRELAAELALGVLFGQARDDALRHAERCEACRAELEAFSRIGDELMHMAPSAEPPSGFEDRVLAGIVEGRRTNHFGRWITIAAAAVVALLVGAGSVYVAGSHERHLAHEYDEVLGTLHGTSLRSAVLKDARGTISGQAVAYEGRPSWIFVAVEHGTAGGEMTIRLVGASSRTLHGLRLADGHGALGTVVAGHVRDVRSIEIVDREGNVVLRATFDGS